MRISIQFLLDKRLRKLSNFLVFGVETTSDIINANGGVGNTSQQTELYKTRQMDLKDHLFKLIHHYPLEEFHPHSRNVVTNSSRML